MLLIFSSFDSIAKYIVIVVINKINNDSELFFQLMNVFDDASSVLTTTNCIFEIETHSADIIFVNL